MPNPAGLPEGEVHVWSARLDRCAVREDWLSPDERARAHRFVFERDRRRFQAARSTLRAILSAYLGVSPETLAFEYTESGKPYLPTGNLRFNLSHSGDWVVYAAALGRDLGIDIEQIQDADTAALSRFFAQQERDGLLALPPDQQTAAFFQLWVRKEAHTKARGEGLFSARSRYEIDVSEGAPRFTLADPEEASRWSVVEFSPQSGYVGALVTDGHDRPKIVSRAWPCPVC